MGAAELEPDLDHAVGGLGADLPHVLGHLLD